MATTAATEPAELTPGRLPIIPEPPKRGAVQRLQKALVARTSADGPELGLSEQAAEAIAYAVADPAETRTYALKHLSYLQVPGGTLTIIRDRLLINRVITYPVNPRVLDTQRFPAAGSDGEPEQLFWPERDLVSDPEGHCALLLKGGTRRRVSSVLQEHGRLLRSQNDKLNSIGQLGVLRPIITMPLVVRTDDDEGTRPRTVLTSVEGSSRTAWSHHFQSGLDPAAPLYGSTSDPTVAHAIARELRELRNAPAGEVTPEELERVRTLLVPAEIIIGFTPDADADGANPADVVDQLLGLTHIDPPKPWSAQATESKIGDKILAELRASGDITADEQEWLAGMLTAQAYAAKGGDPWMARRAARLLWLLSRGADDDVTKAVKRGFRNASIQRRVDRTAKADAAAALALRALPGAIEKQRPIRAALPRAMRTGALHVGGITGNGHWTVTKRDADQLRDAALAELADRQRQGEGPATLELCALATWALIAHDKLRRGTAKSRKDGDPRDPEQILGALMQTELGIRVMHRAVIDDRDGEEPREIDTTTYAPVSTTEGTWRRMSDNWLRHKIASTSDVEDDEDRADDEQSTMTPQRRLDIALTRLDGDADRLRSELADLPQITDEGGSPIIGREGIDEQRGESLTTNLLRSVTMVQNYRDTFRARYGVPDPGDESDDDTDDDV